MGNIKTDLEEMRSKIKKVFVNNIYTENCIPNEWRNAIVTPVFKKGDRRDSKNYGGVNILDTCYKI
jgi:hypothetical protein